MNIPMKKMMSQVTPKHMLENKILLKLEKIFNSIEINSNSTYPFSEPSVHYLFTSINRITLKEIS